MQHLNDFLVESSVHSTMKELGIAHDKNISSKIHNGFGGEVEIHKVRLHKDVTPEHVFEKLSKAGFKKSSGYDPKPNQLTFFKNHDAMTSTSESMHRKTKDGMHSASMHLSHGSAPELHFEIRKSTNESAENHPEKRWDGEKWYVPSKYTLDAVRARNQKFIENKKKTVSEELIFEDYIFEDAEPAGAKLKHIHHAEDRPLMHGAHGFEHAHEVLQKAHEHLKLGKNDHSVTTKYDGSPSIVYGHHPKSGKFFVASKSAFNKNPKINYSHEDIEKNHGHAPGLVKKLSAALDHLPKVAPKKGVFQGDIMHQGVESHDNPHGDVQTHGKRVSYTPNTITYTHKGEDAEKIKKSKLGIVTHTQYHGKDLEDMHAAPIRGDSGHKEHEDVHQHHPSFDASKAHYSESDRKEVQSHLGSAKQIHDQHGSKMYRAIHPAHAGEGGHLSTYINHTVRTDEKPSVEGLKKHIAGKYEKVADKLKTPSNKEKVKAEAADHLKHIDSNKTHYSNLLKMHGHLQAAKNKMVDVMNKSKTGLEHHIGSKKTDPEGYVVHHADEPTKMVNRAEFAKANLLKSRGLTEQAIDAKGYKSATGGLTKKGRDAINRESGSNLKAPVTTPPSKLKPGSEAYNRRKSFCARMGGVDGPMKDEDGNPTRKALALRKWNC